MNRVRLMLAIGAVVLPASAMACDMPTRPEDPAAIDLYARELIRDSTAIIDAEVVTATGGDLRAHLRPLRVLKGPALPVFIVTTPSDCDIFFLHAGQRIRVVLTGGPDLFVASIQGNGLDFPTSAGPRRLDEALGRLLGVPLPAGFVRPGSDEPPPSHSGG